LRHTSSPGLAPLRDVRGIRLIRSVSLWPARLGPGRGPAHRGRRRLPCVKAGRCAPPTLVVVNSHHASTVLLRRPNAEALSVLQHDPPSGSGVRGRVTDRQGFSCVRCSIGCYAAMHGRNTKVKYMRAFPPRESASGVEPQARGRESAHLSLPGQWPDRRPRRNAGYGEVTDGASSGIRETIAGTVRWSPSDSGAHCI
jgi:hypothetical protein